MTHISFLAFIAAVYIIVYAAITCQDVLNKLEKPSVKTEALGMDSCVTTSNCDDDTAIISFDCTYETPLTEAEISTFSRRQI